MQKAIAIIFALFLVLFIAVIVEELFIGGRRKRRLQKESRSRGDQGKKPVGHDREIP